MNRQIPRRRRDPDSVLGRAVVVGLTSAIPIAMLSLLAPLFVQALLDGASLGQAWSTTAPTDEDWEMIPLFVGGAAFIGGLAAFVAAAAWLVVGAKAPGRPRLAGAVAAVVAAVLADLGYVGGTSWPLAVFTAGLAGLIALAAAPRVGYERQYPPALVE